MRSEEEIRKYLEDKVSNLVDGDVELGGLTPFGRKQLEIYRSILACGFYNPLAQGTYNLATEAKVDKGDLESLLPLLQERVGRTGGTPEEDYDEEFEDMNRLDRLQKALEGK